MAFNESYKALKQYDESMETRARLWKHAKTVEDLRLAEEMDKIALAKVRIAFERDAILIAPHGVRENYKDADIMFIRDCVRHFHKYDVNEKGEAA